MSTIRRESIGLYGPLYFGFGTHSMRFPFSHFSTFDEPLHTIVSALVDQFGPSFSSTCFGAGLDVRKPTIWPRYGIGFSVVISIVLSSIALTPTVDQSVVLPSLNALAPLMSM